MSVEAHLAVLEAELASLKAEITDLRARIPHERGCPTFEATWEFKCTLRPTADLSTFRVTDDRRLMADVRRFHADIALMERALGSERSAIIEREPSSLAIKRLLDKRSPGATV